MNMSRELFVRISVGTLAASALPLRTRAAESEIVLVTPTGKIYGTLALPAPTHSGGPVPVVLIIAGSGPTDRNGNAPGVATNTYLLLSQAFTAAGIASLRYDKRGVGASASALASESDIRFDNYIDDAVAWIKLLRTNSALSHLTVAGHSEGSLIGMIAAREASANAYVSLEGAGRPAAEVLRYQLRNLPAPLNAQAMAIISSLEAGQTVANVPDQFASLFRASVQPYLISWFKYNPAAEIAKLTIPVTIVQGTADIQVTMADEAALAAAAPHARVVIVDGMNHVLKYAPDTSTQAAILKGYTDPSLPLDPKAVAAVTSAAQSA